MSRPEEADMVKDAATPEPGGDGAPEPASAGGADEAAPTQVDGGAGDDTVTVEELVSTLEAVTSERDQHLDDLQRVSAEFANFRKQNEKRHANVVSHAEAKLVAALLPVLDACEAAAQQGVEGVDQIGQQLLHILQQEGLEVIRDEGEPFDPNRHEAAYTEPADEDQDVPVVGEVLRTGYALNGRVLRAAMVKVKG